jgi:hypothetical protein
MAHQTSVSYVPKTLNVKPFKQWIWLFKISENYLPVRALTLWIPSSEAWVLGDLNSRLYAM